MYSAQRLKTNFYYELGLSSSHTPDYSARDIFKHKLLDCFLAVHGFAEISSADLVPTTEGEWDFSTYRLF